MFKSYTTYTVDPKTPLDKIFPDGLPVNSFIDKGRCAIGATRGEILNKIRCTLLTVPNISILLSKKEAHPEVDIVYGDVSPENVNDMLKVYKPGQKIMTTPEGIVKIINAAYANGRLEELYKDWFLLLDEGHTFISEHYRDGILKPFDYFDLFQKKTIITATPYVFTDEKFHDLHYYQIRFTESLGTVNLVNALSVEGTLDYFLKIANSFPGNLHIFLNSVTEIRNAILRAGVEDCNIYCANDEKGKNLKTLDRLSKFFVTQPKTGQYKKVNFYTCKFFEGWDLFDENATVLLVTNFRKPHTKIGVASKGKQAIGRLRDKPHKIIHITNHNHTKLMKSLESFRSEYLHEAELLIDQYNSYVEDCVIQGTEPTEDERLSKYADIDKNSNTATINLMKLDQQINESANNEIYNHISYIEKAWNDAFFYVKRYESDENVQTKTAVKRKSASKQLEEDYQRILKNKAKQREKMVYTLGISLEEEIKESNPLAYKADKYLDEATMINLKYNVKQVEAAIILQENILAEVKLLKLIANFFKVGARYTNEYIKSKLQELYMTLNIRDEGGKIKTAKANDLDENGRFETKECKIPDSKGKPQNGQIILRAQFALKMVA